MLTRVLSPAATEVSIEPVVMEFTKDEMVGDILVLTSDGIATVDDQRTGTSSAVGGIWTETRKQVVLLYEALTTFFAGDLSSAGLEKCLTAYLKELEAKRLLEDDCTVSVLISAQALRYRRHLRTAWEVSCAAD
jgi:hypothetical protein